MSKQAKRVTARRRANDINPASRRRSGDDAVVVAVDMAQGAAQSASDYLILSAALDAAGSVASGAADIVGGLLE